jgi:hypothetical protein
MKCGERNWNLTEVKEIRKFGIIALIFFGSLFGLGLWMNKDIPTYFFGILSFLAFMFIVAPAPLRPVYSGWIKIAHFIGKIFTAFMLAIVYYAVITPSALIKRIFGGAPLPLRPDKEKSSYWVSRTEPAQPQDRFMKRF